MSRLWTVITVSKENNIEASECWTHAIDSSPAYQTASEQLGPNRRIIAMIPGCHTTGVKVYPLQTRMKKEPWVDPFETPFDSIDQK